MTTTNLKISQLEEIDFNDFSPTNLVTQKLPSIGFRGVVVTGFVSGKQFDKYVKDTCRALENAKILFNSNINKGELTYTINPKDGYGNIRE